MEGKGADRYIRCRWGVRAFLAHRRGAGDSDGTGNNANLPGTVLFVSKLKPFDSIYAGLVRQSNEPLPVAYVLSGTAASRQPICRSQ